MDNLSIAILCFSFMFSGAGLASAIMLSMLFSGTAVLNHVTLFWITTLLTYYFYGFFGLLYVVGASLALIGCGTMYWFELSVDDMKQKALELKNEQDNMNSNGDNHSFPDIDKKLAVLNQYKTSGINALCQRAGLTPDRISRIKEYYNVSSVRFDNFCNLVYEYACQFRETTKDISGLKNVYELYDWIMVFKKNIESIRSLHKMTRSLQSAFPGQVSQGSGKGRSTTNDSINMNLTNTKRGKGVSDPMESMDQMFSNMKPEDIESMMQQMFGGGDFAKMLSGLEEMGTSKGSVKPLQKKRR